MIRRWYIVAQDTRFLEGLIRNIAVAYFERFGSQVIEDHGWKHFAASTKKSMY